MSPQSAIESKQPVRDEILKNLAIVHHYTRRDDDSEISVSEAHAYPRGALLSVGLDYNTIIKRLHENSHCRRVTNAEIRRVAHYARCGAEGYHCDLPQTRIRARKARTRQSYPKPIVERSRASGYQF